jgi:hypothetical protein
MSMLSINRVKSTKKPITRPGKLFAADLRHLVDQRYPHTRLPLDRAEHDPQVLPIV